MSKLTVDSKAGPKESHIGNLRTSGFASPICPPANVLYNKEVVISAHYGSHAAVADQVRPTGWNQAAHRIFTRLVLSTLRILFNVGQRPGIFESWLKSNR